MEHEFAFIAALSPADRQLLNALACAVSWDVEALAIAIVARNEHYQKALELHFWDFVNYPLPWPWQISNALPLHGGR